jgi:hypothetical protein
MLCCSKALSDKIKVMWLSNGSGLTSTLGHRVQVKQDWGCGIGAWKCMHTMPTAPFSCVCVRTGWLTGPSKAIDRCHGLGGGGEVGVTHRGGTLQREARHGPLQFVFVKSLNDIVFWKGWWGKFLFDSFTPLFSKQCYMHTQTHQPTYFDPQNGGSMYLRNIGSISHIRMV